MLLSGLPFPTPFQTSNSSLPTISVGPLYPRAATLGRRGGGRGGGAAPRLALRRRLGVRALDAAQPFDHEAQASDLLDRRSKLKIGIIGFGNFGQFLARTFARQGHTLLAHSRSNHSDAARSLGVSFFRNPHDLCEEHPDVVLLATSILSTDAVLRSLPILRLRRNTLFVDVLSVKEFPKNLFLQLLPPDSDILCTHPMFGPESGKDSWVACRSCTRKSGLAMLMAVPSAASDSLTSSSMKAAAWWRCPAPTMTRMLLKYSS